MSVRNQSCQKWKDHLYDALLILSNHFGNTETPLMQMVTPYLQINTQQVKPSTIAYWECIKRTMKPFRDSPGVAGLDLYSLQEE